MKNIRNRKVPLEEQIKDSRLNVKWIFYYSWDFTIDLKFVGVDILPDTKTGLLKKIALFRFWMENAPSMLTPLT